MTHVSDEKRKRVYKKRRTRIEMINAVREVDRLMATGVQENTARHACKMSKSSYDLHKDLLLGLAMLNGLDERHEEKIEGIRPFEPPPTETFAARAERIFAQKPEPEPPQGMQSWECPKCGRVNVIWKGTCDCYKG